jgi:endonuclease/exonuclease/phosphatase family metal-dependent hydrolase
VFTVIRLFGLDTFNPAVAFMAFTPWVALLSLIALAVALILRSWPAAAISLLVTILLVVSVAGRSIGAGTPPRGERDGLVVMTANISFGNADPDRIVQLVRDHDVDVLSLQELTPKSVRRLDRAGIRAELPGRVLEARVGAAGSGLMASTRLAPAGRDLVGSAQPEARMRHGARGRADGYIRVKAVHPPPPIDTNRIAEWTARINRMPGPHAGTEPRLLIGDFNATLDHSVFRDLLARGYRDAADETGDGLKSTYPRRGIRPGITIDHILVPVEFDVRSTAVFELPGSDHRAVIARLVPASSS